VCHCEEAEGKRSDLFQKRLNAPNIPPSPWLREIAALRLRYARNDKETSPNCHCEESHRDDEAISSASGTTLKHTVIGSIKIDCFANARNDRVPPANNEATFTNEKQKSHERAILAACWPVGLIASWLVSLLAS